MRAGIVGRAHGLDGHFHVNQPEPQLLAEGVPVRVGDVAARIASRKGPEDRPILRLDITSDRTAAEALRGRELLVERADAPSLDEDEYWAEDLVGCEVVDGSRSLGTVKALLALPSCEALELDTGLIVPLVRDAVRAVDIEAQRIAVDGEFLGAA